MKKLVKVLVCFAAAALLAGCSGSILIFFNNSGVDLKVTSYNAIGEPQNYQIRIGENEAVANPSKLTISFPGGSWTYPQLKKFDSSFRDSGGLGPKNYNFRLKRMD